MLFDTLLDITFCVNKIYLITYLCAPLIPYWISHNVLFLVCPKIESPGNAAQQAQEDLRGYVDTPRRSEVSPLYAALPVACVLRKPWPRDWR